MNMYCKFNNNYHITMYVYHFHLLKLLTVSSYVLVIVLTISIIIILIILATKLDVDGILLIRLLSALSIVYSVYCTTGTVHT